MKTDAYAQGRLDTPFGPIAVRWRNSALIGIALVPEHDATGEQPPRHIADQIEAYFADPRHPFDIPVELDGTPFQRRVWERLSEMRSGETRTYGDLAQVLETAARAIGGACRANPCPIVIPCHRVVGATGLGGFAGDRSGRRVAIKRWLLEHEASASAV